MLEDLYNAWRKVNKNSKIKSETQREREEAWTSKLDDLFDIASANALDLIKNSEDKLFLENQRKKADRGLCMASITKQQQVKKEWKNVNKII